MIATTERTAQVEAFESLIGAADRVLRHPYVQEALGPIATRLAAINDTAFLPDITGGVIRIPAEQQETDHIGLVPLVYKPVRPRFYLPSVYRRVSGSYFLEDSACMPTMNMRQQVFDRLLNAGWEEEEAYSFLEVSLTDDEPLYPVHLPETGAANIHYVEAEEPDSGTRLNSRPIVFTNFVPGVYSTWEQGLTVVHEYVHTDDFEASCKAAEDPVAARAATVARAFHVEVEARLALRAAGFRPHDIEHEELAFEVEYLRREHNTLDNPYATPPELIAGFARLGVLTSADVREMS